MNENKPIIAERIKQLRKEKGLTQEQLADILGLSAKSSIANYENGANSPSDDIKKKMCELFNCSMDYLMGKSNQRKILNNEDSFQNLKKYYEEKISITLKNKYINEFSKLNLTSLEIDSLIKIISSEEDTIKENYYSLTESILSIIALNHTESIVEQTKDLIMKYYQEKLNILNEELDAAKEQQRQKKQYLIDEHIDELHPVISGKTSTSLEENVEILLDYINKNNINEFYMCPVYGQISAGQPNWAEECIEGRIPIDPNLMNIVNPEEHFFLRVNGESMNKVIKNGAYALIHKQDVVEDGEIAVVLVNGYDATLKKFTRQGDLIILEPDSNDNSFKTQAYDKNTSIKILGKYIGKMEFN